MSDVLLLVSDRLHCYTALSIFRSTILFNPGPENRSFPLGIGGRFFGGLDPQSCPNTLSAPWVMRQDMLTASSFVALGALVHRGPITLPA
jgi:hypothetical protein